MTQRIGILSAKGGVGKTVSTINIGAALNFLGRDVAILDANLTTPNIGLYLGVPVVPITIHNVLRGEYHISDAIYLHPTGIKVVPGSISVNDLKDINSNCLESVLLDMIGIVDYVLIDAAAGLGDEAVATIKASDSLLIITNPELPAVTDALKAIKLAKQLGKPILGAVLTRVKLDGLDMSLNNVETMLDVPVIGVIPEDRSVREAMTERRPLVYSHPKSPSAVAYKKLAARLVGEKYNEKLDIQAAEKKTGLIAKFLRAIGL